jgi:amphi-Trp domain-containing protein
MDEEERTLFYEEETKDRVEIASTLRRLADQIESGRLVYETEDLNLELPEAFGYELEIEEETEDKKVTYFLTLELEWNS